MTWKIRPAAVEDIPDLVRADWGAFGDRPGDEDIEDVRRVIEIDRALVALDGDRVVGATAALSLELTVPGPAVVPMAGVTYTGVLPTHRRQGILTALLDRLVDDACGRGEPLSGLLASEGGIYRRFGYGVAVRSVSVAIDRPYARLRRPVDVPGQWRMVDTSDMADVLPPVYDGYRRGQPGEIGRRPEQWAVRLRDPESERRGASARFAVVWEDGAGRPAGYVTYRIQEKWEDGLPGNVLHIEDLVALAPDVRARLWQYCFDVDLVGVVKAQNAPLDEPLWWMLADPRRLRITQLSDFLWLRVLDVEAALAARTYATDDRLVIEAVDERRPHLGGRFLLQGGGSAPPVCRRTEETADVALDVADLAAAYLGGVRITTLGRAGLVTELVPGAITRADRLFATAAAPASCTPF